MRRGAIILCGGKSSRMGQDKATLPFGPECMLQRIVRLISEVIDPANIAVVASVDQSLPPLSPEIRITRDEHPDRGPLEGLAAGLHCLSNSVDAVYATSCDVPLLVPAFVDQMFVLVDDCDIAVPDDQDRLHPLAAVYRVTVLPHIQQLLRENRLRVRRLFDLVPTRHVATNELRHIDPDLVTLKNLNTWNDYQSSLTAAGYVISDNATATDSTTTK